MQRRYFEFGSPITSDQLASVFLRGFRPQVLSGCNPITDSSGLVTIQPGSVLLDSGILLVEDAAREITVPLGASAKQYTCYYMHELDSILGGSPAALVLAEGLVFSDVLTDAKTPLFWVFYPGSSVALAQTHVIPAPSYEQLLALEAKSQSSWQPQPAAVSPSSEVTSLTTKMLTDESALPTVLQTLVLELRLDADEPDPAAIQLLVPMWFNGFGRPRKVTCLLNVGENAEVTNVQVMDRAGKAVASNFTGSMTESANSHTFDTKTLLLSPVGANWSTAGVFFVKFTVTLDPNAYIRVKSVECSIMGATE